MHFVVCFCFTKRGQVRNCVFQYLSYTSHCAPESVVFQEAVLTSASLQCIVSQCDFFCPDIRSSLAESVSDHIYVHKDTQDFKSAF